MPAAIIEGSSSFAPYNQVTVLANRVSFVAGVAHELDTPWRTHVRTISAGQVVAFMCFFGIAVGVGSGGVWLLFPWLAWALEFRSLVALFLGGALCLLMTLAIYRLLQRVAPLPAGSIDIGSREESLYHVHLLFYILLFFPLMKSNLLPVPLYRLLYLALGAKLGANTYGGGVLFDPPFIEIGDNTVIGQGCMLVPHVIEGSYLAHHPIRIGNNVTVGANAIVLADVQIGDNVIIAAGAVVPKGSRIANGEVWGGIPARRLNAPGPDFKS